MSDMSLADFEGRKEALEKITRFSKYDTMFYRTNLWMHSQRVYRLVKDILPMAREVYGKRLDGEKALALALVHDDAEIVTGDVQLADKLTMSAEELAALDDEEAEAIEKLGERGPSEVQGYSYKELLYHALRKDCLEAQLVSLADKLDAYCESLHEIYAGNGLFRDPIGVYTEILEVFGDTFPLLKEVLPSAHPLLEKIPAIAVETIILHGRVHTKNSVLEESGISQYDRWKRLTIEYIGWDALLEKKE
jgi:5'-deoxynucleotidase YfbR-like HD superfamily hydrolase